MQRDLERRDERIRKLELQLRGAYAGIGRAVRSSRAGDGLRDSLRSESDMGDVPETQNVFDLHITDANFYVSMLLPAMLPWPYTLAFGSHPRATAAAAFCIVWQLPAAYACLPAILLLTTYCHSCLLRMPVT